VAYVPSGLSLAPPKETKIKVNTLQDEGCDDERPDYGCCILQPSGRDEYESVVEL
jgi:hypothetical protein